MSRPCRVAEFFDGTSSEPRTLVQLEDVCVSLQGRAVLENINLSLGERTFLGVVGPNGAGKTTLMRVILGLVRPESGDVRVLGMKPNELKGELHHIGYMPQSVLFDPIFPVSVFDVVMMGRTCCLGTMRFPKKADRDAARESIEMVGLAGFEKRLIGELSGGEQKRAFLARALCRETHILLLDEPTAGLDLPAQSQFMDLLVSLQEKLSLSVVFVSHDVGVLARYADELVCINRTMHLHGKPQDVLDDRKLAEAYRCEFEFLEAAMARGPEGGAG